ncbi:RNA-binding protein [Fusibacter sp. JL298sf-3]
MIASTKELEIGQFVKSKSGRDKDKVFIVIEILDDFYVHLVDGDVRKLEKPKKKKVKHLYKLSLVSEELQSKVADGVKFNNAFIRKEVEKAGLI